MDFLVVLVLLMLSLVFNAASLLVIGSRVNSLSGRVSRVESNADGSRRVVQILATADAEYGDVGKVGV